MLKKLQFVFAVLLLVATTACSLFEKDIDVPQEFSFYIDRQANSAAQFSASEEINTADEDVEKYKDDIKDARIDKVTFTVSDYSGQNTPLLTGNLTFAASGSSNFQTLGSVSDVNLQSLANSGAEATINIANDAVKQQLLDLIMAGSRITFKLEGSTSARPVAASLNFKIYSNMTVGI